MAGLGIGFLSAHTIAQELRTKSLVVLDVRGFPCVHELVRRAPPPQAPAAGGAGVQGVPARRGRRPAGADDGGLSGGRRRAAQGRGVAGGDAGRSSRPVVETMRSSSPGSATGTYDAEPYSASKKSRERQALAERDEVDHRRRADRIDRSPRRVLLLERAVAAGDAVEPVRGVQPEHVGERRPLDDVAVDVDVVAGEVVGLDAAVGEGDRRVVALHAGRHDLDARRRSPPSSAPACPRCRARTAPARRRRRSARPRASARNTKRNRRARTSAPNAEKPSARPTMPSSDGDGDQHRAAVRRPRRARATRVRRPPGAGRPRSGGGRR